MKSNGILPKLALFSATLICGSSFFIMKNTLDSIPVFYLLAIRFTAAAVILALFFFKRLQKYFSKDILIRGSILGAFLFLAYVSQTIGLTTTTPGKNAFLTTAYCMIVPFLYWGYTKVRPDVYNISAAVICVAGIGLISLDGNFNMSIGDALSLLSGLFYALHIVAVAGFSKKADIFVLTILQFAFAAGYSWICALIFDQPPTAFSPNSILSLVYLCVFATTLALLLQNIGQKHTHAATASIILSLESVFGVLFSILFYHETLTLKIAVGFLLIFIAVLISETKLEFLRSRFRSKTIEQEE